MKRFFGKQKVRSLPLMTPFLDRRQAGYYLVEKLMKLAKEQPVVIAIARGGVPVAHPVAQHLGAELGIVLVRKIGVPANPEYGVGAVSENDIIFIDHKLLARFSVPSDKVESMVYRAKMELEDKKKSLSYVRRLDVKNKCVILVDDGLAMGTTAKAAILFLQRQGAKEIILAVPVAAAEAIPDLEKVADQVIAEKIIRDMRAVGHWYQDFAQVSDQELRQLLAS